MAVTVNVNSLNQVSSGKNTGAGALWFYSTSDDKTAIESVGYFNGAQDGNNGDLIGRFRVGDVIFVYASDIQAFYKVTSLTANVAVSRIYDAGIAPSHVPVYAGTYTWSGGTEGATLTVHGVLATDVVQATIRRVPSEAAYLARCETIENGISFNLSAANTSNDAVINYTVFRAVP